MARDRPSIRMVDKFGIGRVFVAGGESITYLSGSPVLTNIYIPCVDAAQYVEHSTVYKLFSNLASQRSQSHRWPGSQLRCPRCCMYFRMAFSWSLILSSRQFNLAWKVSLVYKGLSPFTLLDSYTTERLPVIAEMLNITTETLNKLRSASTIESAQNRDKRLNMLGVNYRSSPIVVDEFTQAEPVSAYGLLEEGVLVAGDRAPDATELRLVVAQATGGMEMATRLFDVFRPVYHTVLVFAPDAGSAGDVHEVLKRYPGDVVRPVIVLTQGSEVTTGVQVVDVVVDQGGHAYRAYLAGQGEKKVVVVRPDGVLGAIVHGAEGVGHYFSKILSRIS